MLFKAEIIKKCIGQPYPVGLIVDVYGIVHTEIGEPYFVVYSSEHTHFITIAAKHLKPYVKVA